MHIGRGQQFLAQANRALAELDGLGAQHGVREIQIEVMRRHIRTLGHVAQVAEVALIDYAGVVFLVHAIDLAGLALVHQVKQCGKRAAQADAAATTVANVEDARHLVNGQILVVIVRRLPGYGMASGRRQIAFGCHDAVSLNV